jgi:hypothetical protein
MFGLWGSVFQCEIQSAFFRFAQRAFAAAEIAALPLALSRRFFGVRAAGCSVAFGRPGPYRIISVEAALGNSLPSRDLPVAISLGMRDSESSLMGD